MRRTCAVHVPFLSIMSQAVSCSAPEAPTPVLRMQVERVDLDELRYRGFRVTRRADRAEPAHTCGSVTTSTTLDAFGSVSQQAHCRARASTFSPSSVAAGTSPAYADRQDATCTAAIARASLSRGGQPDPCHPLMLAPQRLPAVTLTWRPGRLQVSTMARSRHM